MTTVWALCPACRYGISKVAEKIDIDDKEGTATTREGLNEALTKCADTVKNVPVRQVITSFAGLRAHEASHEFHIGELAEAPGFVDCAGIESPGLTSSPAIGVMVADIVKGILNPEENPDFVGTRKGVLNPKELSLEERNALIKEQPAYGNKVNDVLQAMKADSGIELSALKVDGGASANGLLMQIQSDIINAPVNRPQCVETTAMGAAYLAGLAVGYWLNKEDIVKNWTIERSFEPSISDEVREKRIRGWNKAVKCAYGWAKED